MSILLHPSTSSSSPSTSRPLPLGPFDAAVESARLRLSAAERWVSASQSLLAEYERQASSSRRELDDARDYLTRLEEMSSSGKTTTTADHPPSSRKEATGGEMTMAATTTTTTTTTRTTEPRAAKEDERVLPDDFIGDINLATAASRSVGSHHSHGHHSASGSLNSSKNRSRTSDNSSDGSKNRSNFADDGGDGDDDGDARCRPTDRTSNRKRIADRYDGAKLDRGHVATEEDGDRLSDNSRSKTEKWSNVQQQQQRQRQRQQQQQRAFDDDDSEAANDGTVPRAPRKREVRDAVSAAREAIIRIGRGDDDRNNHHGSSNRHRRVAGSVASSTASGGTVSSSTRGSAVRRTTGKGGGTTTTSKASLSKEMSSGGSFSTASTVSSSRREAGRRGRNANNANNNNNNDNAEEEEEEDFELSPQSMAARAAIVAIGKGSPPAPGSGGTTMMAGGGLVARRRNTILPVDMLIRSAGEDVGRRRPLSPPGAPGNDDEHNISEGTVRDCSPSSPPFASAVGGGPIPATATATTTTTTADADGNPSAVIEVTGCGVREVNGKYHRLEVDADGVPSYSKIGSYEGEEALFSVGRHGGSRLDDDGRMVWLVTATVPRREREAAFYAARSSASSRLPPGIGWVAVEEGGEGDILFAEADEYEGRGTDPPPRMAGASDPRMSGNIGGGGRTATNKNNKKKKRGSSQQRRNTTLANRERPALKRDVSERIRRRSASVQRSASVGRGMR